MAKQTQPGTGPVPDATDRRTSDGRSTGASRSSPASKRSGVGRDRPTQEPWTGPDVAHVSPLQYDAQAGAPIGASGAGQRYEDQAYDAQQKRDVDQARSTVNPFGKLKDQ